MSRGRFLCVPPVVTTDSKRPPIHVLYVGGFGRSGSTLLAYLLGAMDGLHPVGELRELWSKGVIHDNLCSCGNRFHRCPFWTSVGELAFGGWSNVDAAHLAATSDALATNPRLLPAAFAGSREPARLAYLRDQTVRVYRAINDLTDCSIVVDSSKVAAYALLLANDAAIHLRVIHLVRDSRGVAFSWAKRGVVKPDVDAETTMMDTYGMGATALRWSYHNAVCSLFLFKRIPVTTMRYEQLVTASRSEIDRSLRRLGLDAGVAADDAQARGTVSLGDAHTIGGNPMRFRGSEQAVQIDDEWRRAMPRGARRRVTTLTWPLLVHYGYMGPRSRRPMEVARG